MREQLSVTRALLKFIVDHNGIVPDELHACLAALEREDVREAVEYARRIKTDGMGGLTDWFPSVVHEGETREYLYEVLRALAHRWHQIIGLSSPEGR